MHVRTEPVSRYANGDIQASVGVGPYTTIVPYLPGDVANSNVFVDDGTGNATVVSVLAAPLLDNNSTVIITGEDDSRLDNIYSVVNSDTVTGNIILNTGLNQWDSTNVTAIGNVTIVSAKAEEGTVSTYYDTSAMANVSDTANLVYANISAQSIADSVNVGDSVRIKGDASTLLDGQYIVSGISNNNIQFNNNSLTTANISLSGNLTLAIPQQAVSVEYIVHQDLFGATEYLRILTDGSTSTTTAKEINSWDTEIEVVDASVLPQPTPGIPAAVWLDNSERIEYNRISGNVLKGITRGTRGTTIPNGPAFVYDGDNAIRGNTFIKHPSGVSVVGADNSDVFDMPENKGGQAGYLDRNPDVAIWLKSDGSTKSLTDITNRSTLTTIGAFLHGDLVSSIGFDSVAWDSTGWDSI